MAKRTPGLEKVKSVIPRWVHTKGAAFEKKFFMHWVLWHWEDIVGSFNARHTEPQGIRKEILYLYCGNPSLRNNLVMMQEQITQLVNNYAGQKMIAGIAFSRRWEHPDTDGIDDIRIAHTKREYNWGKNRQQVLLTVEEMQASEQIGKEEMDVDIVAKARELFRKHMQMEKLRATKDWHPCVDCGTLCPKEEQRCPVCARNQREALAARVRQVLRDIPWARCKEVREYVPECTLKLLNDQRASMVQQLATEVDVADTQSIKAKTLVMLYRCLPPEQLTEDEIVRTIYRLRFNLHRPKDYKAPKRYSVIKLGKKDRGER